MSSRPMSLLERYIASVYSGKKYEAWCTMLMQAYDMRALVVLLDGVDEAAGYVTTHRIRDLRTSAAAAAVLLTSQFDPSLEQAARPD